jgi:hypothetical protein
MRKFALLAALVAATLAGAYALLRPAPEKALRFTGVYADDWAGNCGPLKGTEQTRCTARLDDAYGRAAGAPLPK